MRKRWVLAGILGVFLLLALLPLTAAAMTNSEVIAVLSAGITGIRDLARDAYCAAGVAAFCP